MKTLLMVVALSLVCVSLAGASGSAATAVTQTDDARSRQAWAVGRVLYQRGEYRAAFEQFAAGYRLSRKGGFLFNMAESVGMLGDKQRARSLYQRYLREYPSGKHRDRTISRCAALGLEPCEPAAPLALPAEPAALEESAASQPAVSAGARRQAGATAPRAALRTASSSQPVSKGSERPFYRHWGFWLGIIGAAAIAGGATAAILTSGGDSSLPDADVVVDFR